MSSTGDQVAEDYKSFETFATGGKEQQAHSQIDEQLRSVSADDVRARYIEALFTLYQLGWIPPGEK